MPYKDPEKEKEWHKQYYAEHKEERKAYDKEYYKKNKERRKDQYVYNNRKYKARHREEVNTKNNQYMKDRNDISRLNATSHRKPWTPDEDEIVIKLNSRGVGIAEIAERLGRTIGSINVHLVKLRKEGKIK